MGRLIDTSNIRVKPQYIQDVMGIAMIRCEDLSRILADVPTVEAIPKADYENRLKADMVAMLEDLKQDIIAESWHIECYDVNANDLVVQISDVDKVIQQKIDALKGN